MNLIDKDKLLHTLNKKLETSETYDNEYCNGSADAYETAIRLIESAEIVEERKHGHWFDPEDDDGRTAWHCSVCDYVVKTIGFYPNYNCCPCCTAIMDEEVEK